MAKYNPFIENADSPPERYDDAYFESGKANALFDAYSMLRDAGYEASELEPLALLIERSTHYDRDDLERFVQDVILDD